MSMSIRLRTWLAEQVPEADEVTVEGLDTVEMGHSAEMFTLTMVTVADGVEQRDDIVVRRRPAEPGLLEPYDLQRQFDVMRGLEGTDVRAPRALWIEPSGDVLGRPFLVMGRLPGDVYEQNAIPAEIEAEPGRIRRMCEDMIDQYAAVHLVDLDRTGLRALGDGREFVTRELDHWESEMERVRRGPLPAMERLLAELRRQQPALTPRVTLVHGDPKPGNVAFVGDRVSAVFDWELAAVGDPLADVGYLELMWAMPAGVTSRPTAPTVDEFVARYEDQTDSTCEHREWYFAMQVFKVCAIQLVGSMLFDAGHTDDPRSVGMAMGIELMAPMGLAALGVDERVDLGAIYPRAERMATLGNQA